METKPEIAEILEEYCQVAKTKQPSKPQPGKKRVAVCMSGGVDSSATALLLQQKGFDVVGMTGWLIKSGSRCCDTGMIDAARVCEQIGVEHHAVDLRELFKSQILDEFPKSYAEGRTPLPCSVCNTVIKWGALYNYGKKILGADYIATGHYARIVETEDGPCLARAKDPTKDQSYVLWELTPEQLASTLLPLGEYTKEEIRQIAQGYGLASANRPDSQDLCFIPVNSTVQEYLSNFLPESPGPIIHAVSGAKLGEHKGTHNYTIGQRRGLGVSSPDPLYVTKVDPINKTVFVGPKECLLDSDLTASKVNWIGQTPTEPFEALAKIRYNSPTVRSTVYPLTSNQVKVVFAEPQPAVTPGQVLGIYDLTDTYVLGGGWID